MRFHTEKGGKRGKNENKDPIQPQFCDLMGAKAIVPFKNGREKKLCKNIFSHNQQGNGSA